MDEYTKQTDRAHNRRLVRAIGTVRGEDKRSETNRRVAVGLQTQATARSGKNRQNRNLRKQREKLCRTSPRHHNQQHSNLR